MHNGIEKFKGLHLAHESVTIVNSQRQRDRGSSKGCICKQIDCTSVRAIWYWQSLAGHSCPPYPCTLHYSNNGDGWPYHSWRDEIHQESIAIVSIWSMLCRICMNHHKAEQLLRKPDAAGTSFMEGQAEWRGGRGWRRGGECCRRDINIESRVRSWECKMEETRTFHLELGRISSSSSWVLIWICGLLSSSRASIMYISARPITII
jgi:hypothetical protein